MSKFTDYLDQFMKHVKDHDTDLEEMGITFATILDAFVAEEDALTAFHRLLLRDRVEQVEFQLGVPIAFKPLMRNMLRKLGIPIDRYLGKIGHGQDYLKLRVTPDVFAKFIIERNAIGECNWIKDLHARLIRV
jgi:hypothetical protein